MGWPEFLSTLADSENREQAVVLVIDDDTTVLKVHSEHLASVGLQVHEATDGLTGMQKYYSENPDIIITDIRLPGMTGLELLEKIRSHDLDTEIMVLTGQGDLDIALKALKNQASDFLLKPVDTELLMLRVDKALQRLRLRKEIKARTEQLQRLLTDVNSSQKYMETIIQNSPHAMISYGIDRRIRSWNDEAERITGFTRTEAQGRTLKELFVIQDSLVDPEKAGSSESHKNIVGQIMTRDQELRYVSRYANVLFNGENNVAGGVESFIDITENIENRRLLEKRFLQVQTINEIGKRIATSGSLSELARYICEHLAETFFESAQISLSLIDPEQDALVLKATAGNCSEDVKSRLAIGSKLPDRESILRTCFSTGERIRVNRNEDPDLQPGSIVSGAGGEYAFPLRSGESVFGVLTIENLEPFELDDSDLSMLEALSEYVGINTERLNLLERITDQNKILADQADDLRRALTELEQQKEIIEKQNEQFVDELTKAGEFQTSLLPESFPEISGISFYASYTPSSQLGGDFYDVFTIDENRMGLVVADASGHGVTAAILSAMFKMTLQKYAFDTDDPSEILTRLNRDFCNVLQMGEFFTAFYAVYDTRTGTLHYCNAAHPYPLLLKYDTQEILELETEGFLLGVMEKGIDFKSGKLDVAGKARLVIYTDGLTETASAAGTLYGDLRLKNDLKNYQTEPAEYFFKAVLKDLAGFTDKEAFEDDITVLIIDFNEG